jgi:hypothetical protein
MDTRLFTLTVVRLDLSSLSPILRLRDSHVEGITYLIPITCRPLSSTAKCLFKGPSFSKTLFPSSYPTNTGLLYQHILTTATRLYTKKTSTAQILTTNSTYLFEGSPVSSCPLYPAIKDKLYKTNFTRSHLADFLMRIM